MTPERWDQIKTLFNSAIKRPSVERSDFLSDACGNDEDLRREVESLMLAHEKEGSFIDSPAYRAATETVARVQDLKPGQSVGHYQIVSILGKGGMGEVYLAQDSKLDRKVAIKFLNEEFGKDAEKLKRFVLEARSASALNHPNILTVYEIGETNGQNYIATELIDGKTLRELDPTFPTTHLSLSALYQLTGRYAESVESYAKYEDLSGKPQTAKLARDSFAAKGWQGYLHELSGTRPEGVSPYTAATFLVLLGEKDRAFAELNKALAERDALLLYVKIDPRMDPLRSDPRFQELLKSMRFPS